MSQGLASSWSSIVASYAPWQIMFFGVLLFDAAYLTVICAAFAVPDLYGFPSFIADLNIQPRKVKEKWEIFAKSTNATTGNTLLAMIAVGMMTLYSVLTDAGIRVTPDLPAAWEVLRDVVMLALFHETYFYFVHRLLHSIPFLYRNIHKKHHEFVAPNSFAAFYVHPIEDFINQFPVAYFFPAVIFRVHFVTLMAWQIYAVTLNIRDHVGYKFPKWFPFYRVFWLDPIFHDFHHEKYNCNYGAIGIWDSILGTGRNPRAEEEAEEAKSKAKSTKSD